MKSRIKKKNVTQRDWFLLNTSLWKKKKEGNYRKTVREKKAIDSKGHYSVPGISASCCTVLVI